MFIRRHFAYPHAQAAFGLLLATLIVSWPQTVESHHSFVARTTPDGEDAIEVIEGSVRIFRILNPHGALVIDAVDAAGNTEGWLLELSPAAQLRREGWTEDMVGPGDAVTVSIFPSVTENRARLRALLIHGKEEGAADRLLVSYGIRGDTPIMRRLRERLPVCGTIDQSYQRTECFLIDAEAASALAQEFPGPMGYVIP